MDFDLLVRNGTVVFPRSPARAPRRRDPRRALRRAARARHRSRGGEGRRRVGQTRLPRPHRLPRALRLRREDHRVHDRDGVRGAGRVRHHPGLLPQQRGLRRGVRARARLRARAVPRRLRLPFLDRERAAPRGARAVRRGVRRHLVQVLHELQGRGGALPRARRHRRRLLPRSPGGGRAARRRRHRLPHREHRARQPHPAPVPAGGAEHAARLVACRSRRSPRRRTSSAPRTSRSSSARGSTSRTCRRA